jgi:hypothetical protein
MKLIKSCIWSFAVYGLETWTLGKNEERVENTFEAWSWRTMIKIKWKDRITSDEDFQRANEERFFFLVALRPNAGHGLLIHEVSRSHTTTHHSR